VAFRRFAFSRAVWLIVLYIRASWQMVSYVLWILHLYLLFSDSDSDSLALNVQVAPSMT